MSTLKTTNLQHASAASPAIVLASNGTVTFPSGGGGLIPSGAVFYFAASTAPTGYLKADGTAISRTTYADLFAVVGTTYGSGDGSTTFNLPDLRGEFLRGWDDSRGVDSGRTFGSNQADAITNHTHYIRAESGDAPSGNIAIADNDNNASSQDGGFSNYVTGVASFEPGSFTTAEAETRPRNVALLACIKY